MYKLLCRLYQFIFKIGANFISWKAPVVFKEVNAITHVGSILEKEQIEKVLIVIDHALNKLGLMKGLIKNLEDQSIAYEIFDQTVSNPTITNIEDGVKVYLSAGCQGIIAFGGGSPMDCEKGIGARIAQPKKSITQMKGLFKIRKATPLLIAVPTTAGTGSETTIAAVVVDSKTKEKFALRDNVLVPDYAILDPCLTLELPPTVTAYTGMDALCHAIEAYIGHSTTKETRMDSMEAVSLIFNTLENVYLHGDNEAGREAMLWASFIAGKAFTRAYVGNIHALAHPLGGLLYGIPHGLANAVIMPYVLEYYGSSVVRPLSQLANVLSLGQVADNETKARLFIEAIKKLNRKLGIPEKIEGILEADIPVMANHAFHEANPFYPVPRTFSKNDFEEIYAMINDSGAKEKE